MIEREDLRSHDLICKALFEICKSLKKEFKVVSKVFFGVLLFIFCLSILPALIKIFFDSQYSMNFSIFLYSVVYFICFFCIGEILIIVIYKYRYNTVSKIKIYEGIVKKKTKSEIRNNSDNSSHINFYIELDEKIYLNAEYYSTFNNVKKGKSYIFLVKGNKLLEAIDKSEFE